MSDSSARINGFYKPVNPLNKKKNPPKPAFCIDMNRGSVTHLFAIRPCMLPAWKEQLEQEFGKGNHLFGSITEFGYLSIWDFLYRRVAWGIETNEILASWVDMFMDDNGKPIGVVQSQDSGLHVFHSVDPSVAPVERSCLNARIHHGFCRPAVTSNKSILCPSGEGTFYYLSKTALQSEKLEVGDSKSMVLGQGISLVFLHPFVHQEKEYVMFGAEDGKIHVVRFPFDNNEPTLSSICLMDHVSKIGKKDDPVVPLCCAGDDTAGIFVVGTTTTDLPILKWDGESETLSVSQVKSIVNKGIGCLAIRPDKKLLGAGCWDGRIRLFTFPGMKQLVVLDYHKATITSLLFLDKVNDWTGKDQYYLVCGAKDNRLTGWDLFNKKTRPNPLFVKDDKSDNDWLF